MKRFSLILGFLLVSVWVFGQSIQVDYSIMGKEGEECKRRGGLMFSHTGVLQRNQIDSLTIVQLNTLIKKGYRIKLNQKFNILDKNQVSNYDVIALLSSADICIVLSGWPEYYHIRKDKLNIIDYYPNQSMNLFIKYE